MSAPTEQGRAESGTDDRPPAGFQPVDLGVGFATHNTRFFGCWRDDRLRLGFRVSPRLTNLRGGLHGGMLATFADMLLPYAIMYQGLGHRRFLPTINLQVDYIAPAGVGAWIDGEADVLKVTRSMAFAQGKVFADGKLIARVGGIFKLGDAFPDGEGNFLRFAPPPNKAT
ncbi:MAG: PaaI family thioesterase [Burkholderiales bacterium]|nr:PaaI family thioesterase [Burkholderiales bacterium]